MFLAGTVLYAKAAAARAGAAVLLAGHPRHGGGHRRGHPDDQRGAHRAVPDPAALRRAGRARGAPTRFPVASVPGCPRPRRWTRSPTASVAFAFPIYTFGDHLPARSGPRPPGDATGAGTPRRPGRSSPGSSTPPTCTPARPPAGRAGPPPGSTWLGFGAMTFNFFVVNIVISGLHSYAGCDLPQSVAGWRRSGSALANTLFRPSARQDAARIEQVVGGASRLARLCGQVVDGAAADRLRGERRGHPLLDRVGRRGLRARRTDEPVRVRDVVVDLAGRDELLERRPA